MQYHPDMNKGPGAEEKFKEIAAAYEVKLYCHCAIYGQRFLKYFSMSIYEIFLS